MWKSYQILKPYIRVRGATYLAGILFLLLTNAGQVVLPQFVKSVVDALNQGQSSQVPSILLLMGLLALGVAGTRFLWRFFIIGSARRIEADLRKDVFHHLLGLSRDFYQTHRTGDLMARLTNDLDAVRMALGMALVASVDAVFLTLSILIILFIQNPWVALATIAPLPVITGLILGFSSLVGKLFKGVQEAFSKLSAEAHEAYQGIRVIKAFTLEPQFLKKFQNSNDEVIKANLKLVRLWGLFFPVIGLFSGASTLILLMVGGPAVMQHHLTLGEFTATITYLGMLIWPIMSFGMVANLLSRGKTSLDRLQQILQTPPQIQCDIPQGRDTWEAGHLEVKNLSFQYPDAAGPLLQDLSFDLPPEKFLGILGPIGSGKSTLAKLLNRELDPPVGTVRLDGTDIRQYQVGPLRSFFAPVPQIPFLFSQTIAENIAFGNSQVSRQTMEELLNLTALNRDLSALGRGLDTEIGERGVTLSGGQKQRLTLCRALASPSPCLILDDSLSSVDFETEHRILQYLKEQKLQRSAVIISHRTSALMFCDEVLVLDQGKIIQRGAPQTLTQQEGPFLEIYRLQTLAQGVPK